jgi:N-hydroxyarylamine O-acetyltransferase
MRERFGSQNRRLSSAQTLEPPLSTVDLEAYLHRIGHEGPCRADRETLESIVLRHAGAIAFENIEVLAGRVPALELAGLQHKLLHSRRGGYCFEHNLLLLAVLRHVGFSVQPAEARVRANVPADVITGRTHLALRVQLEGRTLLADVGFGGMAPLAPLDFAGGPQRCPDGALYRLLPLQEGGHTALQIDTGHGWEDCYHLGPGVPQHVDHEIGNWFVATHPRSMLGNNLLVARAVDGGRLTLFNHQLTFRRAATGTLEQQTLSSREAFEEVLSKRFGLAIDATDLDRVMSKLERVAAAQLQVAT